MLHLLLSVSLLATPAMLHSQTRQADRETRDRHDTFDRRLETLIDGFIGNVRGEFSSIMGTDTIPERRTSDTANEDIDQWRKRGESITVDGAMIVMEDEVIASGVVVKGGDLTVYGRIEGDALVIGGDLIVKNGGRITGNARVINGTIEREENGIIDGYADRTNASASGYRYDRSRFTRSGYRFHAPWTSDVTNLDNFIYRFNRVEGHFIGLGSEKKYYWDGSRTMSPYGFVGWGFKSHRWRASFGLDRQFSLSDQDETAGHLLEVGLEGHSLTDSREPWIIGANENTAAAVLIHEDYHDYFQREGFSAHSAYYYQDDDIRTQIRVEYVADRYESLKKSTEWSVFGGDKVFRENPPVQEGVMRSVVFRPGVNSVDYTSRGPHGWSIHGVGEFAGSSLGGVFSFSSFVLDVRRYQPIGLYDNFNVRFRLGTTDGNLPAQKLFDIGGLGTLHARPYKSATGNRMILLNAEYILNGDFLNDLDFWPSWLLSRLNFIFLADAGYMRTVGPERGWTDGFGQASLSTLMYDIGFGLSNRSGSIRAGFAWRTDINAPARFFFRFTRPF